MLENTSTKAILQPAENSAAPVLLPGCGLHVQSSFQIETQKGLSAELLENFFTHKIIPHFVSIIKERKKSSTVPPGQQKKPPASSQIGILSNLGPIKKATSPACHCGATKPAFNAFCSLSWIHDRYFSPDRLGDKFSSNLHRLAL